MIFDIGGHPNEPEPYLVVVLVKDIDIHNSKHKFAFVNHKVAH